MKKCYTCELEKKEEDFNRWYKKTGTTGLRSNCKDCDHEINKKFREENKDLLTQKRRIRTGSQPKKKCTDPKKVIEKQKRVFRKTTNSAGYVLLMKREHPNSMKCGRILEHVYEMSNHLGRALIKGENVHHKNGDRADNRMENLELWTTSHPSGQRHEDKIKWCIDFLTSNGYKVM